MSLVRTGVTPERLELAAKAAQLRARGMTIRAAASELGVSRSYASELIHDPDGSRTRARKDSYAGTCSMCGGPTSGSEGPSRVADVCGWCNGTATAEKRTKWTRERIIGAIREYVAEYGEPPATPDWSPTSARAMNDEARAVRAEMMFARGRWPWFTIVIARFGTWNAAIEAAGFQPRRRGGVKENTARRRDRRAAA